MLQVSHNTGLARDIREQAICLDENAKPLAEFNAGDGHQRYYFPSCRALDGNSNVSSDSIKEESKESDARSAVEAGGEDILKIKATTSSRMSTTLLTPLLLAAAPRTPTTPISEILTPVSEPAFLLASICSTMEKLPLSLGTPTDPSQDSALLQTYLRERAVQDARVKQSQYHPRLRREGPSSEANTPVGTPGTPTSSTTLTLSFSNAMNIIEPGRNSICTTTFTSVSQLISSHSGITSQDIAISRPPPLVWAVQKANKFNDSDTVPVTSVNTKGSLNQCIASSLTNVVIPSSPSSPVLIKQEKVLSPVKSVPMPSPLHSTSLSLINLSGSRSRTSSETDVGTDSVQESGQSAESGTMLDVKAESPVDDKTSSTQTVITIVSSSGSDTFALPVTKISEEAAGTVSSGTTGSHPSANSVIVTTSGSSSPPHPPSTISKRPKAEFMPPSSGPAPSYVR